MHNRLQLPDDTIADTNEDGVTIIERKETSDVNSWHLMALLTSFDMIKHVKKSDHRCGNTLDLVITFVDCRPDSVIVDPPGVVSDHGLVVCQLTLTIHRPSAGKKLARDWRRVNRTKLRYALKNSQLCDLVSADADIDQLFTTYNTVLHEVADRLAPLPFIHRRPGLQDRGVTMNV